MKPSARTFASVVIRNSRDQILLVQELKSAVRGKYNLPGGHVEPGESPLQAAIREVLEETGLRVQPRLLGEYPFHAGTNVIFLADTVDDTPHPNEQEILACGWYSIAEISQISDADILNPQKLRAILRDLSQNDQQKMSRRK